MEYFLFNSLIASFSELQNDTALVNRVAESLLKADLYEKAGELFEKVGQTREALQSYRKGQAFSRAVELARHNFPGGTENEMSLLQH